MKLAVISPVNRLQSFSSLGHFDFALAHVLLEEEERGVTTYSDYFRAQSESGRTVFLDNGAHEESRVSAQELVRLAKKIKATHVIAPDELKSSSKTLELTKEFLDSGVYKQAECKIIAVAQGAEYQEWLHCYNTFLEDERVDVIAIPYDVSFLTPHHLIGGLMCVKLDDPTRRVHLASTMSRAQTNTRVQLIKLLAADNKIKKPIHLLGWSLPTELAYYKHETAIKDYYHLLSNDSQGYCVYPLELDNLEIAHMQLHLGDKIPTPLDFWRDLEESPKITQFIEQMFQVVAT